MKYLTLRLGSALLATAAIDGVELELRATRGAELGATLERSYEWTLQGIEVRWRDDWIDMSSLFPSLRLRAEHTARWSDTWERVRDGRPAAYRRAIDALGTRFEWEWTLGTWSPPEAERARVASVLEDTELRATRADDGWDFEPRTPRWLREEHRDGLAGAVGWGGVLADSPVAAGTRWSVPGAGVAELLRPLGRPRMELESFDGEHPELFALLCRVLDPCELLELADDDPTVRYLHTVHGVAELELVLDGDDRLELAERGRAIARELDIDGTALDRARLDIEAEGGGRLRWSRDESRPVSAELHGTLRAALWILVDEPLEMEVHVELEGGFRQSLTFTYAAPEDP